MFATINKDDLGEIVFQTWQECMVESPTLKYQDLEDREKELYRTIGVAVSIYAYDQIAAESGIATLEQSYAKENNSTREKEEEPKTINLETASVKEIEELVDKYSDTVKDLTVALNRLKVVLKDKQRLLPFGADVLYHLLETRFDYLPEDYILYMTTTYADLTAEEIGQRLLVLSSLDEPEATREVAIAYFVLSLLSIYGYNN